MGKVGIVLLVLLLATLACGSDNSSGSGSTVYAVDFVDIESSRCKRASSGSDYYLVEGTVKNTSSTHTLVYVELRGTLFNSYDKQVNTNTSYADSDEIGPGETSTFDILIDDPQHDGRKCKVEVEEAYFPRDD